MTEPAERVLVAMSGGVDSSVAAALLRDDGHEVVGVTMKLWGGESDTGCCSVSDVDDARRVADALGIDHYTFGFADEFDAHVVTPYVEAHAAGRTPNPCIECNRHLKFDRLLARAEALGFDTVATGHHARIVTRPDGTRRVARGADAAKDQSYVLHMLTQEQLARLAFPLGHLTKDRVRKMAAELGLRTAAKPDSQDVCFITTTSGRGGFLAKRMAVNPGRVVDTAGHEVGDVEAVELVTIGQRRGLHLAGGGAPRYVTDVDVASRTVTVGTATDLERHTVDIEGITWAAGPPTAVDSTDPSVTVQCSAHGSALDATVELGPDPSRATVRWRVAQRRVAPGQSVVLYDGDEVIGGGTAT